MVPSSWDLMMPHHRYYAFAHGAGADAVKAGAKTITATKEDLKSKGELAGHLLIPQPDKSGDYGDSYYDLGS